MGDNGAGKSTLAKCIARAVRADTGEVRMAGRTIGAGRDDALAAGIGVVWQDLSLCDNLDTVANLFLGRERRRAFLDEAGMRSEAERLLAQVGIDIPGLTRPVVSLSGGQRQAVAVTSSWAAPITGSTGVLGTISGYGDTVGRLRSDQLELIMLYASHAAGSIERERLFAESRRRNRVLEAIRAVLEVLAGPSRAHGARRGARGAVQGARRRRRRGAGRPVAGPGGRRPPARLPHRCPRRRRPGRRIFDVLMRRTVFGRHVFAIGGNAEAARRAGIRVDRVRTMVFVLASTMAATGGILGASRLLAVNKSSGGGELLLNSIAAAVIGGTSLFGGRGSAWSALLGALVIGSIANGMDLLGQTSDVKFMVTGAVLLVAATIDAVSRRGRHAAGRA